MKLQLTKADYLRLSDEELVHRYVQRKEQAAVTALFEKYGHLVFGICLRYFPSPETAQNATRQLFINLLDDLYKYKIERFKPWLYQSVHSYCRSLSGKPTGATSLADYPLDEEDAALLSEMEEAHLLEHLENELQDLKKEQRLCIEMFYLQQMPYQTIASKTKYSLQQVKRLLQMGISNLKNKPILTGGKR